MRIAFYRMWIVDNLKSMEAIILLAAVAALGYVAWHSYQVASNAVQSIPGKLTRLTQGSGSGPDGVYVPGVDFDPTPRDYSPIGLLTSLGQSAYQSGLNLFQSDAGPISGDKTYDDPVGYVSPSAITNWGFGDSPGVV